MGGAVGMEKTNGLRVAGRGAVRSPLGRAERAETHRGRALSASTPEDRFVEAYRAARSAAGGGSTTGPGPTAGVVDHPTGK